MTVADGSITEWEHGADIESTTNVNTIFGTWDVIHEENQDQIEIVVKFYEPNQQTYSQAFVLTGGSITANGGDWSVTANNITVPGGPFWGGRWEISLFIDNQVEDTNAGDIISLE